VTAILEHQLIGRLVSALPRSPAQRNRLHETDAELVSLPGSDTILAVTTDGLVEELATGLYRDPWHIGWMLVMVNASDLAAVGAEPLGLVLCESLPSDTALEWVDALQRGIADAAIVSGLGVLGGDTNTSAQVTLVATALGVLRGPPPLTRRGARPGDVLYASARLGTGGAYALARMLAPHGDVAPPFRPAARLAEGRLLRGRATACMDTSDGAFATLDELMELNGVGFRLDTPLEAWTDRHAVELVRSADLAPWMLHAGPHGEYELLFTASPGRERDLLRAAAQIGWTPVRLGTTVEEPGLELSLDGTMQAMDTRRIRNLFAECGGDPREYVERLMRLDGRDGRDGHSASAAQSTATQAGTCSTSRRGGATRSDPIGMLARDRLSDRILSAAAPCATESPPVPAGRAPPDRPRVRPGSPSRSGVCCGCPRADRHPAG